MNIAKEISRLERKQQLQNTVKKAFSIIKSLLCQHKECYSEVINVELGNCTSSLLEEILGTEESLKTHRMKLRIVRCANCGREIFREYLDEEVSENPTQL